MRRQYLFILILSLLTSCAGVQKTEYVDAQIELGLAYLAKHDNETAKKKLLTAVEEAPHYPLAWDALAYYMEQTDGLETAEDYYKKAIKFAPKTGGPHNNYAVFLCKQARFAEALKQFDLALSDQSYLKTEEVKHNKAVCESLFNYPSPPSAGR